MHSVLTPAKQAGTRFTYPGGTEGQVGLGGLVKYQNGITRQRSPISLVTRLDVE